MASISMDIATTFIGLAKRQTTTLSSTVRGATLFFPLQWRTNNTHHRNSPNFPTLSSTYPKSISISFPNSKRLSRRFTVAATATPTKQDESSDVLTKIPPDSRIPATIITGFLGSGKVTIPINFNSFRLRFGYFCLIP